MRALFGMSSLFFAILLADGSAAAAAQWVEQPIGRDAEGRILKALVPTESARVAPRVLVVGGVSWLKAKKADAFRGALSVSAVDLDLGGREFPPKGTAYNKGDLASQYLWRWIGAEGFDQVFVIGRGGALKAALEANDVAKVGNVPCRIVAGADELDVLIGKGVRPNPAPESAAARIRQRRKRTPVEVAAALSTHYGKELRSIAYIPSLAVIGRRRLAELTGRAELDGEAKALIEPWLGRLEGARGKKVPGGSAVAGYLVFVDAFDRGGDPRAKKIVLGVASWGLDAKSGKPVDVVPNHSQMSDSVFMDPPLLAAAGRLSGDPRYFQACLNHIRRIQEWCLRRDGLYRHSPLDEAAWGRGNGFPALGLALVLGEIPESWSGRAEILKDFRDHLSALVKHQDATGMWHQVVDHPESYRELTSTCMITFAILRGMRKGWLDPAVYREPAGRAWEALKGRIGANGLDLIDVCTGTGKQKNLEAYFRRTAILGRDGRGGAMALLVATEQAFWEREALK